MIRRCRLGILYCALVMTSVTCLGQSGANWLSERTKADREAAEWAEVSALQVHEIRPNTIKEAEALLQRVGSRALEGDEVRHFVGSIIVHPGMQIYLIRAERNEAGSGRFSVLVNTKGDVAVIHGSLAVRSQLVKTAIAVELPHMPRRVFVEVDVAQ